MYKQLRLKYHQLHLNSDGDGAPQLIKISVVYGGLNHLRCKLAIKIIDELIACFIVVGYEASLVLNAHGDGRVIGIADICKQDDFLIIVPDQ